jgi:cell division protein FtsB
MSEQTEQEISSQSSTRRPRQLSSTQVMFAVILAIALMLAVQFSSRISEERRLDEIRDTVQDEIELLSREQAELLDQLAFVGSDAYVEEWARSEGRMVRDNMVLVIPLPARTVQESQETQIAIGEAVNVETTLPEPEAWLLWWRLFFDMPPPI